jgi:hypothetical protein
LATPSRAVIYTQIQDVVDLLEEWRKFGRVNAKNLIAMFNTIQTDSAGDYVPNIQAALSAYRQNAAVNISPAFVAALLRPLLQTLCKSVIGRGDPNNDASMNYEIYKYFVDQGQRVQSRNMTYGTPVAGASNVGNNQIIRLARDQYNFPIENTFLDQKRILCVSDYQTGTQRGSEIFTVQGQTPAIDNLERSGSGFNGFLQAKTTDDSLLFNASWTQFSGTASAPTAVTNWTSTDLNGVSITPSSSYMTFDSTNYFRAAPSDASATSYAIKLVASQRLSQKLSVRGTKLRTDRPYLLAIVWNAAVYTAQGTLTARMGNTNRTVTVTGATGWNVTLIPAPIGQFAQQSCWPRLFERDDMSISIDFNRSSGSLLIDDVLLLEGQITDGTFAWCIPASTTTGWVPSKINDVYTYADIAASDSKIQKFLWWGFGTYWPHSFGSSITLSDP